MSNDELTPERVAALTAVVDIEAHGLCAGCRAESPAERPWTAGTLAG